MVVITKELAFPLPDALSEPRVIKDFFPAEMFERVRKAVSETKMGTFSHTFHTMLARWETSIEFDKDIEDYVLQKAQNIFNEPELKKSYFFTVMYQRKDNCIPHLWEHTDQNGTQTTIDITVENTAGWGITIEEQFFEQKPNEAVIFCGQQHIHSRPPYPTKDPTKFTTVLFLHFTQPNHWIQKQKRGIVKYGKDGDLRFFNRNRFLAMPDGPLNQPVCPCHDYSSTLGLYDEIAGHAFNEDTELTEIVVHSKNELAPGIMLYKTGKDSSRIIKGLIQNSMFKQWMQAEVLVDGKPAVNYDARSCFNFFLDKKQNDCHPQDPIVRAKKSLEIGIDSILENYRERYSITPLISHHTVLLRYEEGNMFHNHYDAAPMYPRIVSVSMFLNDDFDGGEIEFKEFNLKIKPDAGDVLVFSSSFPYMHQVHPVTTGIRYSVVKWYEFIKQN